MEYAAKSERGPSTEPDPKLGFPVAIVWAAREIAEKKGNGKEILRSFLDSLPGGKRINEKDLVFAIDTANILFSGLGEFASPEAQNAAETAKAAAIAITEPDEVLFAIAKEDFGNTRNGLAAQRRSKLIGNILMASQVIMKKNPEISIPDIISGLDTMGQETYSQKNGDTGGAKTKNMFTKICRYFNLFEKDRENTTGKQVLKLIADISIAVILMSKMNKDEISRVTADISYMENVNDGYRRQSVQNPVRNFFARETDRSDAEAVGTRSGGR